jgi:hypothetical protein
MESGNKTFPRVYDLKADKEEIKELILGGPNGFGQPEEVLTFLDKLGVERKHAIFIRYKGKYYGVLMQSLQKELIIGSDRVWFMKDGYFLPQKRCDFKMPYTIKRRTMKYFTDGIVEDMLKEDPNLMTFTYVMGKLSEWDPYIYKNNSHLVLLGLTFKDTFYSDNNIHLLNRYFEDYSLINRFFNKENISFINPFKTLAVKDGKLFHYRVHLDSYGVFLSF